MKQNTWSVFTLGGLAAFGVFTGSAQAAIPVNACGAILNVPGGQYVLTANLMCPAAPAVTIAASGVGFNLQGFTIAGLGVGSGIITASGPSCLAVTDVIIENGTVARFGSAIDLCAPFAQGGTAMRAVIRRMTLTANVNGVRMFNSNLNTVVSNRITDNRGVGVSLANSHAARITSNTISTNASSAFSGGVYLRESNKNTVDANTLDRNGRFGIFLQQSSDNAVSNNTVTGTSSGGVATTGIVVIGPAATGNSLRSNIALRNETGISLGCSAGCALVSAEVGGVQNSRVVGNRANDNRVYGIDSSDNTAVNVFEFNGGTGNGVFDGHDDQGVPPCGSNTWTSNSFATANQACVQ